MEKANKNVDSTRREGKKDLRENSRREREINMAETNEWVANTRKKPQTIEFYRCAFKIYCIEQYNNKLHEGFFLFFLKYMHFMAKMIFQRLDGDRSSFFSLSLVQSAIFHSIDSFGSSWVLCVCAGAL